MRRPDPAPATALTNDAAATVAGKSAPDSPAQALGRRILSTAFVMVGPDGRLTVERHDGQVIVLRDVAMRAGDYCGTRASGGPAGKRYCGGYAEVAAARPGGAATPAERDVAVPHPPPGGRAGKHR